MKIKIEENSSENQLVWAGMRYCPYWPAKIVTAPPTLGKIPANKTCVLFFGTKQFGFVEPSKIAPYIEYRSKYAAKGKGAMFHEAVQQMEEYISDPLKNKCNALVKRKNVVVKTEHVVEESLGIKREVSETIPKSIPTPNVKSWAEEKQTLIDKIVQLKSENQQFILDLKQLENKVDAMTTANKELRLKISQCDESHLNEMSCLRSKLTKANDMIVQLKADKNRHISELMRERDLSKAKLKQLENSIMQNQQNQESEESDGIHEVECILRDKLVEKRAYLVRWKGYDSTHDSWVLEPNLQCPKILKKYKQMKR